MLYLEVSTNLSLLDCLDKEALKRADVASPAVAAIAERLETRIAAAVLTDGSAAHPGGLYRVPAVWGRRGLAGCLRPHSWLRSLFRATERN